MRRQQDRYTASQHANRPCHFGGVMLVPGALSLANLSNKYYRRQRTTRRPRLCIWKLSYRRNFHRFQVFNNLVAWIAMNVLNFDYPSQTPDMLALCVEHPYSMLAHTAWTLISVNLCHAVTVRCTFKICYRLSVTDTLTSHIRDLLPSSVDDSVDFEWSADLIHYALVRLRYTF